MCFSSPTSSRWWISRLPKTFGCEYGLFGAQTAPQLSRHRFTGRRFSAGYSLVPGSFQWVREVVLPISGIIRYDVRPPNPTLWAACKGSPSNSGILSAGWQAGGSLRFLRFPTRSHRRQ